MLAEITSPLEEILDHPWRIGGREIPWMSSQIALMILLAVALAVALPVAVRRRRGMVPRGFALVLEMLVVFVRNLIVAPAIGPAGRAWVPFLTTLLVFVLGCNLLGLVPLLDVSRAVGLKDTPIGGVPTGSVYVCAALAGMTFGMLLVTGYGRSVMALWRGPVPSGQDQKHAPPKAGLNLVLWTCQALQRRRWPLPVAVVAGVPVWLDSLVPRIPGLVGLLLWPVLLVMEVIGHLSRCVALCIRLFANMTNGHLLLAVMVLFAAKGSGWAIAYVSLPSAAAAVAVLLLDTLVAVIQAYIFTFLTALYIGLAAYPRH
jgi:F-type H+-transporting ATPase subunit a